MKKILISLFAGLSAISLYAESFIAVDKSAKIFDSPNAKGYVTLNTADEEVVLSPGMAVRALENSKGWYLVEYSPGIRGYLSEEAVGTPVAPSPGTYKVVNNPKVMLKVTKGADGWSANDGADNYKGVTLENIVVFLTSDKTPAYTLVDFGEGGKAVTYDNAITKFF